MNTTGIRAKPSQAVVLYDRGLSDLPHEEWEANTETLSTTQRVQIIKGLTDPDLLTVAILNATHEERLAVADNEHTPSEILADIANDLELIVWQSFDGPGTGLSVEARRSPHPNRAVLNAILTLNPSTPVETIEAIIGRRVVPGSTVSTLLATYYATASIETQLIVASHPRTPAVTLGFLTAVRAPQVRVALILNPNTPLESLAGLVSDGDEPQPSDIKGRKVHTRETPVGLTPAEAIRTQEVRIRATVAAQRPDIRAGLPLAQVLVKLRFTNAPVLAAAASHYNEVELNDVYAEEVTV